MRKPTRSTGLGLGLSFVSWIVEVHDGRIDVASTVGEGTRFRILLPRDGDAPHTAPAAETGAGALHWKFPMSLEIRESMREGSGHSFAEGPPDGRRGE